MNGNYFKYNIGDTVIVVQSGMEAKINGCHLSITPTEVTVSYDVYCKEEHFINNWVPVPVQYMGNQFVSIRVSESDLEGKPDESAPKGSLIFTYGSISKDDVDSMRAAWHSSDIHEISVPTVYANDAMDALKYAIDSTFNHSNEEDILYSNSNELKLSTDYMADLLNIKYNPSIIYVDTNISEKSMNERAAGPTPSCDHKWLPYEGLTQKFDYCEKCDVKKNL